MIEQAAIAVIGGSGLYNMPEITDKTTLRVETPFGPTSADIAIGTLRGKRVAFLPRHGHGHSFTPSTVPYRANIYALKALGVRFIIAVNACGSLREEYAPGHIVIPDQLFDHTKADRGRSFFDTGLVGHVSVADPFTPELREILYAAVQDANGTAHNGGNFIVIEGPRFSTKGESRIFQQWGCDIIGMTTCPEAFLAREAEIAYATMAHITDYDVWHTSEAPVTVDQVIKTMHNNLEIAQNAVANAVEKIDETSLWDCHTALNHTIMTAPEKLSSELTTALKPILSRYLADNA